MNDSKWLQSPSRPQRHWNIERVEAELERRGVAFHRGNVLHGRQIILSSGELINVFPDGRIEVTGSVARLAGMLGEWLIPLSGLDNGTSIAQRW
jgi:hypothetical protein